LSRIVEAVIREVASPIILKLLSPLSSKDVANAIEEDVDITELLLENEDYLHSIKKILSMFPYSGRAVEYMKRRKWVAYFVANELKHSRPDLYAVFAYHPLGMNWLLKNLYKLSELLSK